MTTSCLLCGQPSVSAVCGECSVDEVEERFGRTIDELEQDDRAAHDDEMDRRAHQAMEEGRLW